MAGIYPIILGLNKNTRLQLDHVGFLYSCSIPNLYDCFIRLGSNHADEIPLVFGYAVSNAFITNVTYTDQQKAVSRAMMTMWTNFAKSRQV